jgi:transposase
MPRPYAREFREGALALVGRGERPVAELARELGMAELCLRRWMKQDQLDRCERDGGVASAEREELRGLGRENARLRREREILRKAAAFFARDEIR